MIFFAIAVPGASFHGTFQARAAVFGGRARRNAGRQRALYETAAAGRTSMTVT